MATPVVMPKQGNSVEEVIIVDWKKEVGDPVTAGDVLVEVETDKAVMEVESSASGILLAHFFAAGDMVPVMANIAVVGAAGEDVSNLHSQVATSQQESSIVQDSQEPIVDSQVPQAAPMAEIVEPDPARDGDIVAISPRARNLAQRKGVALTDLTGSGPNSRIIERDVEAALATQSRVSPVAKAMLEQGDYVAPDAGSGPSGRIMARDLAAPSVSSRQTPATSDNIEVIPVRGVRKVIAERMLASLQTTAQLTMTASAEARALLAYRQRLKASDEAHGLQRITINDLLLFAVSRLLGQQPDLNALFYGDEIHRYHDVHLGFAVDTPRGLLVPVIHHANQLTLKQIAQESSRLAQACIQGKAAPDELTGGTFTVSNLGNFGVESFTPVLNPPQVAILGVGNINLKPVQGAEQMEFIPHMSLSLTVDHQAVDGAPGARFLQVLTKELAEFELLLAR